MIRTAPRVAADLRAEAGCLDRRRWLNRDDTVALANSLRGWSGDLGVSHTRTSAALYQMAVGLDARLAVRHDELTEVSACLRRHADAVAPPVAVMPALAQEGAA